MALHGIGIVGEFLIPSDTRNASTYSCLTNFIDFGIVPIFYIRGSNPIYRSSHNIMVYVSTSVLYIS